LKRCCIRDETLQQQPMNYDPQLTAQLHSIYSGDL